jgi:hypothetical protein
MPFLCCSSICVRLMPSSRLMLSSSAAREARFCERRTVLRHEASYLSNDRLYFGDQWKHGYRYPRELIAIDYMFMMRYRADRITNH